MLSFTGRLGQRNGRAVNVQLRTATDTVAATGENPVDFLDKVQVVQYYQIWLDPHEVALQCKIQWHTFPSICEKKNGRNPFVLFEKFSRRQVSDRLERAYAHTCEQQNAPETLLQAPTSDEG